MDEPATSNDNDLFFECDHSCRVENLAGLHPAPHVLVRLKDIFLERVHPLMNVYHIPSFWDALMNALRQPQQISNSLLAEIFAFYLACISSLTDVESESLFGTGRLALHRQYRRATRQALINAGFLSTASPMTLRAFGLFIVSGNPRRIIRAKKNRFALGTTIEVTRSMPCQELPYV